VNKTTKMLFRITGDNCPINTAIYFFCKPHDKIVQPLKIAFIPFSAIIVLHRNRKSLTIKQPL